MLVREIMTSPTTVAPSSRVAEVARLMTESGAAGLPVVDVNGAVVGIVSQLDLVAKHARVHMPRYLGILGYVFPLDQRRTEEDLRHVLSVTAADLMTDEIVAISPEADIDDAATLMVDRETDPLLVMEDDRLVGVVNRTDIIRLLVVEEADDGASATT